ncbi:MAG TPA: cyclodeaminase/cyclohydrolase family protein [Streptosporangiaceae bacterium]
MAGEQQTTGSQGVGGWLAELASSAPTPGGGGAAAVSAAMAAALVEMVCRLTIGKPAWERHEPELTQIRDTARDLRLAALAHADADATAFGSLLAAYRLGTDTEQQKTARAAVIQQATLRAATVPLEIAATAAEVARLAARLPGRSNPSVLSDVAVAAVCAATAVESAAVNVEINLASLHDHATKVAMTGLLDRHLADAGKARQLVTDLRREIAR